MSFTDAQRGFLFSQGHIRGQWVNLEHSIQALWQQQNYPPLIRQLLGELSAAVVMMASTLKFEGTISIHAKGNGPISLLSVETNNAGALRGLAKYEAVPIHYEHLRDLFGEAALAISLQPEKGEAYQGIVPINEASLSAALAQYFARSEQLATQFYLFADDARCAGLLLQAMPAPDSALAEQEALLFEEASILARTLKADELLTLEPEIVLHRLFSEHDIQVFEAKNIRYQCRCSRDKAINAIKQIPKTDVMSLLHEQGKIEVGCEFCGKQQIFVDSDLAQLLKSD